jgi:DNA-directed RNA polymerase subunit M/transcription elongation factor TFIIS
VIFLAQFSLAEAESAEATLAVADIDFERKVVEQEGLEYIELSVNEADYERALVALDALETTENSDIDLKQIIHCPRCSGTKIAWFQHETNEAVVELLFCECSGDHPVAMRDWETKLGRILPAPGEQG